MSFSTTAPSTAIAIRQEAFPNMVMFDERGMQELLTTLVAELSRIKEAMRQADERANELERFRDERERFQKDLGRWLDRVLGMDRAFGTKLYAHELVRIAERRGDYFADYQIAEIIRDTGVSESSVDRAQRALRNARMIRTHEPGCGPGNRMLVELLLPAEAIVKIA